jgi:hypothetical protein
MEESEVRQLLDTLGQSASPESQRLQQIAMAAERLDSRRSQLTMARAQKAARLMFRVIRRRERDKARLTVMHWAWATQVARIQDDTAATQQRQAKASSLKVARATKAARLLRRVSGRNRREQMSGRFACWAWTTQILRMEQDLVMQLGLSQRRREMMGDMNVTLVSVNQSLNSEQQRTSTLEEELAHARASVQVQQAEMREFVAEQAAHVEGLLNNSTRQQARISELEAQVRYLQESSALDLTAQRAQAAAIVHAAHEADRRRGAVLMVEWRRRRATSLRRGMFWRWLMVLKEWQATSMAAAMVQVIETRMHPPTHPLARVYTRARLRSRSHTLAHLYTHALEQSWTFVQSLIRHTLIHPLASSPCYTY